MPVSSACHRSFRTCLFSLTLVGCARTDNTSGRNAKHGQRFFNFLVRLYANPNASNVDAHINGISCAFKHSLFTSAKTLLSPPNFIFHCMQFWHIFFSFFLFLHSVYLCTFSMPINFIAQYIYIEWCFCSYFVPTVIFIIETAAPQEMHWCGLKRNRCMPPLELYIPYNSGCVFKFVRLRECRKKIYKPHKFINICTTKNTTWERQRKKCWE